MKSEPSEKSTLETQCLFGETVTILDKNSDWYYCKLKTDNYKGWVKKEGLSKTGLEETHRVIVKRSFIYKDKTPKSNCLMYLPTGARVLVENIYNDWSQIKFFIGNEIKIGFVPSNHIVCVDSKVKDWVTIAQQLEGTPYRWGGRDTVGLDCSALLQLSYQTYGQVIPRNTSDQVNLEKPNISEINNLRRGCVIFWEGHVGIMIDKINCIHANAYHMKTLTEKLSDVINRMGKNHQIIKMMDFN